MNLLFFIFGFAAGLVAIVLLALIGIADPDEDDGETDTEYL